MLAWCCKEALPLSQSNRATTSAPCRSFLSSLCWYLVQCRKNVANEWPEQNANVLFLICFYRVLFLLPKLFISHIKFPFIKSSGRTFSDWIHAPGKPIFQAAGRAPFNDIRMQVADFHQFFGNFHISKHSSWEKALDERWFFAVSSAKNPSEIASHSPIESTNVTCSSSWASHVLQIRKWIVLPSV